MNTKKDCAGTYSVSGYVKKDGTEVSSYMRTCGAKHEGRNQDLSIFKNNELKDLIEKYLVPINKNYLKPKTLPDLQGYIELNHIKSDSLYHKYYKLALDYENQKYFNNDNIYVKFDDIKDEPIKKFIKNNTDINYKINDFTNVVIPQYNSDLAKKVFSSISFKNLIKKELSNIKAGLLINKPVYISFKSNFDLFLSLGNATLYNLRIQDDYICGSFIDYYDFEDRKYEYIYNLINNNAYQQQIHDNLTNYLIIFPIRYPISDL